MASPKVAFVGRLLGAVALVFALVGVHVVLAAHTHLPIVQGDELGYIENSRYLALGGFRPANSYFPGLSVLLVPVWWFTTHALTVWRAAQAVNIAAALATVVGGVVLGGAIGLSKGQRWLVAMVASLYPAVLLYSDFSLSESLFQAVFMWLVVAVVFAARSSAARVGHWGLVGVLAGCTAIVHPRGYAVDVAVVVVALCVLWPRSLSSVRQSVSAWVAFLAGLVGSFGVLRLLSVATTATNVGGRFDYLPQSLIGRNESAQALGILLVSSIGRILYQSIATGGLVPLSLVIGAVSLARLTKSPAGGAGGAGFPGGAGGAGGAGRVGFRAGGAGSQAIDAARALPALSAVGIAGFTMLLRGTRADQLIQGRYVDAVVPPLLVTAMAAVMLERRWRSWAVVGLAATFASGLLFSVTRHLAGHDQTVNPANILGIEPLVRRLGSVDTVALTMVGLAAVATLTLIARFSPVVAFAVLAVAFSLSAVDTQARFISSGSASKASQTVLVHAITSSSTDLGLPRDCVSFESPDPAHGVLADFNFFSDRLLLGTRPLQLLLPGQTPCGSFVISGRGNFAGTFPGARLVTEENDVREALYVLPGDAQDRLRRRGWLLPDATPGPLPVDGQNPGIRLDARPLVVPSGGTRVLRAEISNDGDVSPWPAASGLKQKVYAVRVATRWFSSESGPLAIVSRGFDLPHTLLPGDHVQMAIPLTATMLHGAFLPPGPYVVEITVYQESVGNFGRPITIQVDVRA